MKKLLVLTFLFIFAMQSVGLAAISSSKGSSAPRTSTSVTQKAPSTSSGYKSSAPASSYSEKAPTAAAKQQVQQQQSNGNGFLRSAAMFGGGMLMGSMLGNMFGFGSYGMFSEIIGLLFNLMIIALLFKAARYIWNRFRANRQ